MIILNYGELSAGEQARMRARIATGDWAAARYLYRLLSEDRLRSEYGETTRLLLGVEDGALAAFCTLAERDEVDAPELTPWIGFVFTFPEYRGRRLSERMIAHACELARSEGRDRVYLTTNEIGLYEKYGFTCQGPIRTRRGEATRWYCRSLSQN